MGELFKINSSKKIYHANKIDEILTNQKKDYLPYVVRTTLNNGVRGFINENEIYANDENTLSFAQDTFSVFYQKQKYFTGNKVKVLKPKFHKNIEKVMRYLAGSFQKSLNSSTWGLGSTVETIGKTKISLPQKDGEIDFNFMESFIAEVEAEKIARVKKYLSENNLENCTLTIKEKQVLEDFENEKIEWGEFKIENFFEIDNTLSFNKDELTMGGDYDYITRTSQNQGIFSETGFVNKENINLSGTWSLGLLQMDFFYRKKPWYAGQFVRKITSKIKVSQNISQFFSVLLNKQKDILLSVLVRNVDNTFNNLIMQLPTKNNQPDYNTMETLISAVQKNVVKNVAEYIGKK